MTITFRTPLRRILMQSEQLDPQGLTPFVALHLGVTGCVHVRRTSAIGLFATVGAPAIESHEWVFVAYTSLQDALRVVDSEKVEIIVLPNGGTAVRSIGTDYATELRVHTVDRSRSGFKRHNPGDTFISMDPTWLLGLNTKSMVLASPPVIHKDRILLLTGAGAISWQTTGDPGLPCFPRESFVKAISGFTPQSLELTSNGFYHASFDGVTVITAGHRLPTSATASAQAPGSEPILTVNGNRLIQGLEQAMASGAPASPIRIDPRTGITVKNEFGATNRFSIGDLPAFSAFSVTSKTAKVITETLKQVVGDVSLQSVPGYPDTFRFTRASASVTFRTIIHAEH